MDLTKQKCKPCEGGVKPLARKEALKYLGHAKGWELSGKKIARQLVFKDFMHCIRFINKMARVAEREGHHPDFNVHYRKLDIEIWTHAIGGLSVNDFILAAKINRLYGTRIGRLNP